MIGVLIIARKKKEKKKGDFSLLICEKATTLLNENKLDWSDLKFWKKNTFN